MNYSPVRYKYNKKIFIQLACIKYIKSVQSEPGSNSRKLNKKITLKIVNAF